MYIFFQILSFFLLSVLVCKFGGVINVYFTRLLFPFLDLLWLISSRLMNNLMVFCLNVQKMTKSRKLKSKRAKMKNSASPDRSGTLADRSAIQEENRRIPEALAIDRATCADRSPEPDRSRTTCRSIGHARQNRGFQNSWRSIGQQGPIDRSPHDNF